MHDFFKLPIYVALTFCDNWIMIDAYGTKNLSL